MYRIYICVCIYLFIYLALSMFCTICTNTVQFSSLSGCGSITVRCHPLVDKNLPGEKLCQVGGIGQDEMRDAWSKFLNTIVLHNEDKTWLITGDIQESIYCLTMLDQYTTKSNIVGYIDYMT